jgi:diacylglycerol kinase
MLTEQAAPRGRRADAIICLVLAAVSVTYLMLRRWPLGTADEAYYFYHAIRTLNGEVLYRDVFELTTPFLMDLLALAFHLFGETITTGRAVGSAVQALLILAIYTGARAVGAGRMLAVAAALTHLAIGQPAWPYTTPHWLAVLLTCALLLIGLDRQRARTAGWTVAQGLLLGLLIATRQHAGVAVGAGIGLLMLSDALGDRRWGRASGLPLGRNILTLAIATLAGAGLVMIPHVIQAGPEEMINQLLIHPLTGYRDYNKRWWGWGGNFLYEHEPFTWPALLKYLPAVVAVTALRAAAAWLRRRDRRRAETLLVLAVFGACAIAFTMSFPDYTHLAMIMPIVLIVAVELLVSALRTVSRRGRVAETVLGLALIVACTVQLQRNYAGALAHYPILYDTAFGRLPFATSDEIDNVERVKAAIEQSPDRDLFCYPGFSAMYLMTGARNPTRHEAIAPKYQSDEEIQGLIETLERKRVGHILLVKPFIKPDDPVAAYIARHYRCSSDLVFQLCARHDER